MPRPEVHMDMILLEVFLYTIRYIIFSTIDMYNCTIYIIDLPDHCTI